MKILLLGAAGTIGNALHKVLSSSDCDVLSTVHTVRQKKMIEKGKVVLFEVNNEVKSTLSHLFRRYRPAYVINCIGIIRPTVKMSERDVWFINALFPHLLAEQCSIYNSRLIQISTDCVFKGDKGRYKASDVPDNSLLYGRTKFFGEINFFPHITVRTSIIGRELHTQRNLLDWYLHTQMPVVPGYSNAWWNGVSTITLAKIIKRIIDKDLKVQPSLIQIAGPRIDKCSLLRIIRNVYGVQTRIKRDASLMVDRTIIPWRKQNMYFGDLMLPIKDQILELKKYYPNI